MPPVCSFVRPTPLGDCVHGRSRCWPTLWTSSGVLAAAGTIPTLLSSQKGVVPTPSDAVFFSRSVPSTFLYHLSCLRAHRRRTGCTVPPLSRPLRPFFLLLETRFDRVSRNGTSVPPLQVDREVLVVRTLSLVDPSGRSR